MGGGGGGGAAAACPQTSLAAHAFGARNMLRLVLKSGYGPGTHKHKSKRKTMNRNVILNKDVLLLNSRKAS